MSEVEQYIDDAMTKGIAHAFLSVEISLIKFAKDFGDCIMMEAERSCKGKLPGSNKTKRLSKKRRKAIFGRMYQEFMEEADNG